MMKNTYYLANPCPNCGQEDQEGAWMGARMQASTWGHSVPCCSEKCGIEYGEKLAKSKKPKRIAKLRGQIQRLENDLIMGRL